MKNFSVLVCGKQKKEFLMDMSCGLLLLTGISWLYYDTFLAVFFLSPLLIIWHREGRDARKKKEKEQFLKMFREWILLLASSLSAGYSVEMHLQNPEESWHSCFQRGESC